MNEVQDSSFILLLGIDCGVAFLCYLINPSISLFSGENNICILKKIAEQ